MDDNRNAVKSERKLSLSARLVTCDLSPIALGLPMTLIIRRLQQP